jgi:hypothetical protein
MMDEGGRRREEEEGGGRRERPNGLNGLLPLNYVVQNVRGQWGEID